MNSEERSRHALCGARKKNGEPCRNFAGEGTDHKGIGNCKDHLGNARNNRKNAVMVKVKRDLARFGQPVDVAPAQALMGLLRASAGTTEWLLSEIQALEEGFDDPEAQALIALYNEERKYCGWVSKACIEHGVEDRMVKLAQETTELVVRAAAVAMAAAELTDDQRAKFEPALMRALGREQDLALS